MPEVHDITSAVEAPSKAFWKTGLKYTVTAFVVAVIGSAVYYNVKKDSNDETTVETPAA